MDQTGVLARVTEVVAKELGIDQKDIHLESKFAEDLGADSLDLVQLIIAVEDEFEPELKAAGLKDGISDEEAEKMHTVGDIVGYIVAKSPG